MIFTVHDGVCAVSVRNHVAHMHFVYGQAHFLQVTGNFILFPINWFGLVCIQNDQPSSLKKQ